MRIKVWGTRGSIAAAGPRTMRYGGNTVCLEVTAPDSPVIVLDAGTGMRPAGIALAGGTDPVHILITHLHMDHIQGLGFFLPLFDPGRTVHIWGPPSTTADLRSRLTRYMSPPLFPVRIRDLGAMVEIHDVPSRPWTIGALTVSAATVIHPGATLGYRLVEGDHSIAYIPDHEPALGGLRNRAWTSGIDLARHVDVLFHDAQYTPAEYDARVGWGHSSTEHAARLADLAEASRLGMIHHEPAHDDAVLDEMLAPTTALRSGGDVFAAAEGMELQVGEPG